MPRRDQRILQEIALLATRFDAINYDDEDFTWVHLPCFELPAGWSKRTTELLILLPPAYPQVPPNGFFIDQRLRTRRGGAVDHYYEDQGPQNPLGSKGWAWYCIHADRGNWSPTASVLHGDNLLKYVELIRTILTEIARG